MTQFSYFDNAATTPLDPEVFEKMLPLLKNNFANPSSLYSPAREAKSYIQAAREQLASLLNCEAAEIIFTSGATEANNLALLGLSRTWKGGGPHHIIISAIEHPSVLSSCRELEKQGVEVSYLRCDSDGLVSSSELEKLFRPHTRLVSVMTANNVTGVVQPISQLAALTHVHGALFHTDAVQAAGKLPIDVRRDEIDLLSLSAHKMYGPKGVGALYVRRGTQLSAIIYGGGQENGLRAGTENVAGIVGLGASAQIACERMAAESAALVQKRNYLVEQLERQIPNCYLIGNRYRRLPGHICLGFKGQENDAIRLLLALDQAGIAVSSGSACSSQSGSGYVLQAMGFDPIQARGILRISMGRFTSDLDCQRLLEHLPRVVSELSPIASRMEGTISHTYSCAR